MHWQPSMKLQGVITHRNTAIINTVQCENLTSHVQYLMPYYVTRISFEDLSHMECSTGRAVVGSS